MAYKRLKIGAVLKSKDTTQPDYIKIDQDITLKKGDILNLESKKSRLAQVEKSLAEGKLTEEVADKIKEEIDRIPEFIRFQIVKVNKN